MARSRQRVFRLGFNIGVRGIRWTHSYWGEIASGTISADMSGPEEGWLRIQIGGLALQLRFCFEVSALSGSLVSPSPE